MAVLSVFVFINSELFSIIVFSCYIERFNKYYSTISQFNKMLNKILDQYSQLKIDNGNVLNKENQNLLAQEQEVLKNFLILYDNDVKKIHANQIVIEKDLQELYTDTQKLNDICKQGLSIYDDLVEYFKETGDLFNWCTILEKEINEIHQQIIDSTKSTLKEKTKR